MRARNIKPGFYKNADLAECSIMARFLFPGLWMLADREGRLEDRPKQIKGEVFPFDNVDVNSLLDELSAAGMLIRYAYKEKRYIQISNFLKHQRPHNNETASEIPEFSDTCTKVESTFDQGEKHFALNDITLMMNPSSLNDESITTPNGVSCDHPKKSPINYEFFKRTWKEYLPSLPQVERLTDARKAALRNRWNDFEHDEQAWFKLLKKIQGSDWLMGRNDKGFTATFDWVLKPANMTKILEGNYDNRGNQNGTHQPIQPAKPTWTSEAERVAAHYRALAAEEDELERQRATQLCAEPDLLIAAEVRD